MLDVALSKRPKIIIFGDDYPTRDGTCIRDYIHVSDLADAHLMGLRHLLDGNASDIFNLGSAQGFSVREILEVVREVTGHAVPAEIAPRREGDPAVLLANSEKCRRVLGWVPRQSDIRSVIKQAWQWHKKRHRV